MSKNSWWRWQNVPLVLGSRSQRLHHFTCFPFKWATVTVPTGTEWGGSAKRRSSRQRAQSKLLLTAMTPTRQPVPGFSTWLQRIKACLCPRLSKNELGGALQSQAFCPSHRGEVILGNWEIPYPCWGVICLTWLKYNRGSCDGFSSFPALVAHTEDLWGSPAQSFASRMLGNFQEPELDYFPFTNKNNRFGFPVLARHD